VEVRVSPGTKEPGGRRCLLKSAWRLARGRVGCFRCHGDYISLLPGGCSAITLTLSHGSISDVHQKRTHKNHDTDDDDFATGMYAETEVAVVGGAEFELRDPTRHWVRLPAVKGGVATVVVVGIGASTVVCVGVFWDGSGADAVVSCIGAAAVMASHVSSATRHRKYSSRLCCRAALRSYSFSRHVSAVPRCIAFRPEILDFAQ